MNARLPLLSHGADDVHLLAVEVAEDLDGAFFGQLGCIWCQLAQCLLDTDMRGQVGLGQRTVVILRFDFEIAVVDRQRFLAGCDSDIADVIKQFAS